MRQFDRRLAYHFDWLLLGLTLIVTGVGIATIYSATASGGATSLVANPLAVRQAAYATAGLIGLIAVVLFDYRRLERWAYVVYALIVILLILVPLIGAVGGGARRWIDLGVVSIQPSEIFKVGLVIALARYFHHARATGDCSLQDAIPAFLLLGFPGALVLAQPDLGTVGLISIVCFSVLFFVGLRLRAFALLGALGGAAVPLLWSYLKPYQQQRVMTFLSPEMDPLGAGYHIIQSKIAIGSGEFWGKGFLHGTQTKLHFLPEQHTDFIFSVFAEEWGYVGAVVLLLAYLVMILRGLQIAGRAKDRFGAILAFGVTAIVFWQVAINVAMTAGVLPVVGIPLPLISYGGSSLTTTMIGMGLLINVNMRRFLF
jgi:rod shape determining protein RodA